MLKTKKFWGITLGAGVLIGLGSAGLIHMSRSDESAVVAPAGTASDLSLNSAPIGSTLPLDTSSTPSPSATPGLEVTNNGNQGAVLGDSSSNSATATPSPNELPGPSDFGQYDKYASNSTALYEDVQVGTGGAVASGSKVTVQYTGWLTNGAEFDSTDGKSAFTFTEGAGQVIPGWEEGIFGMKVGGRRRLIIPPGQGYGAQGKTPIPPNAVLVFDITLVSVQ